MTSPEILTFGCRLNSYESQVMRGHLAASRDPHPDGLVVVNTCAVTGEAERQARQAIRRAHRERPGARIVVTGCAAQIDPARWASLPGVSRVLGNSEKLRPEQWTAAALASDDAVSDIMQALETQVREVGPHLVTDFVGRTRAFLQVQQGCDHRCSFCIIPFGRGPSRSVAMGVVVRQAQALVRAGYNEIVLTGVDITSYGADLPGRPALGQLVRRLLALVPELARLRLSSLDPAAIDDDLWHLVEHEPRLMPHLHLSLQAAADLVLKRMKRRHSVQDAAAVIRRARRLRPGIGIGADLIAGFPTEDAALFEQTLAFVREHAVPYLHVFPYSERPGTPAARMPAIPVDERRRRAQRLREAGREAARAFHAGLLGQQIAVVLEAGGRGHSEHFAPVRLQGPPAACVGAVIAARVLGVVEDGLLAEPT
ncbi:tRNA (N(6)-L-threonylcarbamoyladenosine(37)-C(2))-methylthiotransferase MtaB [Lichenicoccus sp.]|uniref:tRNA (N(6)-L-threonylcarbamoyladenosine(37)-C(2))- methylthiotransferase MtaB n=1 Tax=Lichenicoccus sp. TaxID=2781899 RepID=UPI003D0F600C